MHCKVPLREEDRYKIKAVLQGRQRRWATREGVVNWKILASLVTPSSGMPPTPRARFARPHSIRGAVDGAMTRSLLRVDKATNYYRHHSHHTRHTSSCITVPVEEEVESAFEQKKAE